MFEMAFLYSLLISFLFRTPVLPPFRQPVERLLKTFIKVRGIPTYAPASPENRSKGTDNQPDQITGTPPDELGRDAASGADE